MRLESEVASWFSRVNVNQACMPFLPAAGGRLPCLPDSGRHAWHVSSKLLEVFVPSLKIREQLQCEVELFLCILSTMCNRVFYVWHWRILPGKAGYLQADLMPVQEDKSIFLILHDLNCTFLNLRESLFRLPASSDCHSINCIEISSETQYQTIRHIKQCRLSSRPVSPSALFTERIPPFRHLLSKAWE